MSRKHRKHEWWTRVDPMPVESDGLGSWLRLILAETEGEGGSVLEGSLPGASPAARQRAEDARDYGTIDLRMANTAAELGIVALRDGDLDAARAWLLEALMFERQALRARMKPSELATLGATPGARGRPGEARAPAKPAKLGRPSQLERDRLILAAVEAEEADGDGRSRLMVVAAAKRKNADLFGLLKQSGINKSLGRAKKNAPKPPKK